MKALRIGLTLLLGLGIYTTTYSQGQSGYINYQGVASNATGEVISNENITVKIALRYVFPNATTEYEENHPVTTDTNGVFSLQIGKGVVLKGDYYLLEWQLKTYVTVSIDGVEIGTTEMNAVPYALRSGDPKYWSEVGTEEFKMIKDNSYSVIISNKLKVDGDIKLQLGSTANEISVDGTLSGNSDEAIPTEKAVKRYVDKKVGKSNYSEKSGLNTGSIMATSTYQPIGPNLKIEKNSDDSFIEVTLNTRVYGGVFSSTNGVYFEIRIDGKVPDFDNKGSVRVSNSSEFISMFAVFKDLSGGINHSVQVYVKAQGSGTSTGVWLDPGGWSGSIIAKETF